MTSHSTSHLYKSELKTWSNEHACIQFIYFARVSWMYQTIISSPLYCMDNMCLHQHQPCPINILQNMRIQCVISLDYSIRWCVIFHSYTQSSFTPYHLWIRFFFFLHKRNKLSKQGAYQTDDGIPPPNSRGDGVISEMWQTAPLKMESEKELL